MSTPLVAILMGSKNDMSQMEPTEKVLTSLDIPFETKVMSAHRNQDKVRDFAKTAARGIISIANSVSFQF